MIPSYSRYLPMGTVDSGQQNYAANTLSQADEGGEQNTLTKYQEEVKEGSPAVNAATLESLMQEQEADSTTAVTVDEVAHNPPPQHHPTPTIHMQEQLPLPPHLISPQPTHSILQLVYLQPTPHGVNIIPIQAAGQPYFTPYSPPGGFPAHPLHPVVVQPGLPFPLHHPAFYPSHPVYTPGPYPAFPQYYQGPVPHLPVGAVVPIIPQYTITMVPTPAYRQQFFRPWEDGSHTSTQSVLCPHTDCGGEGGQHSQPGCEDQQLPPYSEEDFPALTKGLSKIKIKK
jgi:hypothetical protein